MILQCKVDKTYEDITLLQLKHKIRKEMMDANKNLNIEEKRSMEKEEFEKRVEERKRKVDRYQKKK